MAMASFDGVRIRGIGTCVPSRRFNNLRDTTQFDPVEVQKVVAMAGIEERRLAGDGVCSTDLCAAAARALLDKLGWEPGSIDALIMVTQTPDYILPSAACVLHQVLGLTDPCAAFDLGLGCSGYPYALWLATMMLRTNGFRRVLLCHGETPSRYAHPSNRAVSLLFGDAGSATALELPLEPGAPPWFFALHTDGAGWKDMLIEGGGFRDRFPTDAMKHYVQMQGSSVFNFTIKRLPALISETLQAAALGVEAVDYFIFHQSNRYIIQHVLAKSKIPAPKAPLTLKEFGNPGGPSVPLTITQGALDRSAPRDLRLMLLGYGVGLSWASALVHLPADAVLEHVELKVDPA
jgi:3-oxoacyl-[acyl-carrier-protein] synthase III